MSEAVTPKFKRILLKLSGEALMGSDAYEIIVKPSPKWSVKLRVSSI